MITVLSFLLLGCTLAVRWALAHKQRWGWWLDLASVAPWLAFYVSTEAWPLLAIPLIFGALDVKALRGEWR